MEVNRKEPTTASKMLTRSITVDAAVDEKLEVKHEKSATGEDSKSGAHCRGGRMRLRRCTDGNGFSGFLGLARSFHCQSAFARRCLCDLRGQLAKSLSGN